MILWTWKLKLGLVILGLSASFWFLKYREARAYERGKDAGQSQLLDEQRKQLEKEYAETKAKLDQERADLDQERTSLQSQRKALSADLTRGLNAITSRETSIRNEALSIPDIDLVPRIRTALSELRTAESGTPQ